MSLPFHSFTGTSEQLKSVAEPTTVAAVKTQNSEAPAAESAKSSIVEPPAMPVPKPCPDEIIMLDDDSDEEVEVEAEEEEEEEEEEVSNPVAEATDESKLKGFSASSPVEIDDDEDDDEPMSLSELSSSFQKCLNSNEQAKNLEGTDDNPEKESSFLQINPFDYEAARKQAVFGEDLEDDSGPEKDKDPKPSKPSKNAAGAKLDLGLNRVQKNSVTVELPQGKRRHAFPATGNRSATFR